MKKRFFGTDGIRGKTGVYPITPDFFVRLAYATGLILTKHHKSKNNPTVVIGKDTRISGYMFESALEAGFSAAGVDTYLTGPIPTPAIAQLTQKLDAEIGVAITASHNPFDDNGIKIFTRLGTKLAEETEVEIEELLDKDLVLVAPENLGKARRLDDAYERYIRFCLNTVPKELDFKRYKVVIDCAHGATYQVAPKIFRSLGANIIAINVEPDGLNINKEAGSNHPSSLVNAVKQNQADLGIAFDGDGDRILVVNQDGEIIDGDQILYILLNYYQQQNWLKGGLVGTQMTNLALEEKCLAMAIPFYRSKVGDRYVAQALREKQWMLGGENSGHIVLLNHHSTGDGIISALQLLSALEASQLSLNEALSEFILYPQKLINLPIKDAIDPEAKTIKELIREAELIMRDQGRVLIRPSGTQPLLRIMTEGPDEELVVKAVEFLADQIS
ncbi:MAG: phosphoglucosamine mutase [Methylophilaceae bacterium]|nr:phosphoglucosamine mutase [Methylophilaceae bacterium]